MLHNINLRFIDNKQLKLGSKKLRIVLNYSVKKITYIEMKHPVKNEVPIEFQDCPLAVTRQKDESSPANC